MRHTPKCFVSFIINFDNNFHGRSRPGLQASRPATLLTKRLCHRCFPANFVKFLRTPFFWRQRVIKVHTIGLRHIALMNNRKFWYADHCCYSNYLSFNLTGN